MQKFTVKAIRRTCSWVNGITAHLDAPSAEEAAFQSTLLTVTGWIASRSDPIRQVWLNCVGRKIAGAKTFERLDVREALPDSQFVHGFEIAALPLGLGVSEPLRVMVECVSGKRTALFEIDLAYAAQPAAAPSGAAAGVVFAPIVALPRSGTTYLSQLLHSTGALLGDDQYPYELRLAEQVANDWLSEVQPWMHAAPADRHAEVTGPNYATMCALLRTAEAAIAGRPALDLHEAGRSYRLEQVARLYRLAASKPNGFVISEKIGLGVELELLAQLGAPVKPIFIVRDPRDAILSMRRFNENRGVYEFHEPRTKHFNDVVMQIALDLLHFTRAYERWEGDKLLVRYDDLVAEPQRTRAAVLAFIGIDPAASTSIPANAIPDVHITSGSPSDSLGRWRSELTPGEIAVVNWYFSAFLRRFGYDEAA